MAFNTALERLYMSATVPPTLESYLIIDPADPYSVLTQVPQTRIFVPQASLQAYAAHEWWSQYILIGGTEEHTLAVSTTRVGTLGQAILGQGIVYAAVNHLSVSGPLNSDDIYLIRDSLKNLFTLDLSQAAITTLPSGAFQLCRFSSIVLPSTLRDMGSSAFVGCQNLQELEVPEGVLCADNLVSNCQQLKRLDLPSTLVSAQRLLSAYNFDETQNYECTITCRSFFPPKTGGIAVFTFGTADVRLQVPAVSASAYASAAGWKELSQHATVDAPALISVVGQHELSTDGLPADYRPSLSLIQQGNYGGYGANNTFGQLTVMGSKLLDLSTFTAYTDLYSDRAYTGRYGCKLMVNAPMTAEHVRLDFDMSENRWYFLSFPFDVKLRDVLTASNIEHWVVRSYSSANRAAMRGSQWQDVPFNGTLEARRGYAWMVSAGSAPDDNGHSDLRVSVEATGNVNQLFAQGDVSIPLSDYASTYEHNASWNFVGNPYPCYYRIGSLQQTMPITVWRGNYSYEQYRTYSPLDDADHELHPYEAFFVQKPPSASTLTFAAVGLRTFSEQPYTISLSEPLPLPVVLEDRLTGIATDLTADSYTFTSRPGRDDVRFVLLVGLAATGIQSVAMPSQQAGHPAINLLGQPVADGYRGIIISNGKITIKR